VNDSKIVVLIVDDDSRLARAMARTVADPSLEVLCAFSPHDALQVMASRRVDVVVSDLEMPEMNGIELLSHVRRQYRETIRIMLTGAASMDRAIAAINEGEVHRFFKKPLSGDLLRNALLGFSERIARMRREGELASRDARRREFFAWFDERCGATPPPLTNEAGEMVVSIERLEARLQIADAHDALELIGALQL
jgi:DNA-binding NtrC family response regulator